MHNFYFFITQLSHHHMIVPELQTYSCWTADSLVGRCRGADSLVGVLQGVENGNNEYPIDQKCHLKNHYDLVQSI